MPSFKGGRNLRSYLIKIPIVQLIKGTEATSQAHFRAKRFKLKSWDLSNFLLCIHEVLNTPPCCVTALLSNSLRIHIYR